MHKRRVRPAVATFRDEMLLHCVHLTTLARLLEHGQNQPGLPPQTITETGQMIVEEVERLRHRLETFCRQV